MRLAPLLLPFLLAGFPVLAGDSTSRSGPQSLTVLRTDSTWAGQRITYPSGDSAWVTTLEVVIPPGGETGWHWHPFPGYAYIVSGTLTLEAEGGRTRVFHAGESFAEAVRLRHNGRNLDSVPLKLVGVFTGKKGVPISVKDQAMGNR